MSRPSPPRPPRFWALLARLLLRGGDASFIRADLEDAFVRDLERGVGPRRARQRYALNVLGSICRVWAAGLKRLLGRGALLDAKLGVRMLGKQPLLTAVAMLALGLGIPASLTMVHMVESLTRPLPVPEGERVMGIRQHDLETGDERMSSVHDFALWREDLTSFRSIGAARSYRLNLNTGDPSAPSVGGARMTTSAFEILRTPPLMGRVFDSADEDRGAPDVVVLGEDLWASRFGRDPGIVGTTVRIGRRTHEVVGVMPSSFRFPMHTQVWLPLRARPVDYAVGEGPRLHVFGRLADGTTLEQAKLELEILTRRLAEDRPDVYGRLFGEVVPMPMLLLGVEDVSWSDPELVFMQSIMLALLFLVCGNVGTLLLARTATRTGEITIRTALGASRGRIIAQLFVEALVLAVASTGLGLLFAEGVVRWLMRIIAPFGVVPVWADFTPGPFVVVVALGLAVLSAVVAGVLPALRAMGRSVQANLQRTAAGGSTMRFGWGSTVLIVSEVVLSVGFLAIGGTMVRSYFQDVEGRLGFQPERYMTAGVRVPWLDPADYPELADDRAYRARLRETQKGILDRLGAEGEVVGVGMAREMPGTVGLRSRVVVESEGSGSEVSELPVALIRVGVSFFRGLDRPILAGRDFSAADVAAAPDGHRPSVIVNTSFVEQVLGGQSAVGRRFRYPVGSGEGDPSEYEWFQIVGVVGPFGVNAVNPTRDAAIYLPHAPGDINPMEYLVEVAGDPTAFVARFREIVASVDSDATVEEPMPLVNQIKAEATIFRWLASMEVGLAGVAFLLSLSGLYALMSFTVSQRTREIGIRTALGARPWSIVSTIARRAAFQLGVGLALGAVWAGILLDQISRDVMVVPIDIPATIAVTLACAALVGVGACASPTLRGLRIQPTEALREL